jgi:maltose O-acetyltransferase
MVQKIYLIIFGVLPTKILNKIFSNYLKFRISKYPNIHKTATFGVNCVIYGAKNNVFIGENTYVNDAHIVAGLQSIVKIGKNSSIGYRVSIKASTHALSKTFHDENGKHLVVEKDIIIGDRCWIGDGAYIKEGVVLGNDVVVGANSVVTKKFPNNSVIGGVPAKLIKYNDSTREAF